jgi:hypothetical protein
MSDLVIHVKEDLQESFLVSLYINGGVVLERLPFKIFNFFEAQVLVEGPDTKHSAGVTDSFIKKHKVNLVCLVHS